MKDSITRRDFMNGVAIGTGTALVAPSELLAQLPQGGQSDYYPPILTGMRGNHPGSFEVSHALAWAGSKPALYRKLDEHYDLVIVGAGVSGLAAARFYQKKMGTDTKILLLDNHDDFGGHAKRNEFQRNGRTLLGIGGSINIDSVGNYSKVARGLLDDLGIDLDALESNMNGSVMLNTSAESMLALPAPGGHVKIRGQWNQLMLGIGDYESAVRGLNIQTSEQDKLIELISGDVDYLDDLSLGEKSAYIKTVTYAEFLTDRVGLSRGTISIFYPIPKLLFGSAAPRISVMEAFFMGGPGIKSMGWLGDLASELINGLMADYQSLYFPDGNASIARLLVQKLIPAVAPESRGFNDIATSQFNYEMLDVEQHAVRVRLNSSVVSVTETEDRQVTVDYVHDGEAASVTGDHCVLACYNAAIPYICPQLPDEQKKALRYSVKVPLVMTNVLVDNGHAFAKLGVSQVTCPDDPYLVVTLPPVTTTGGHQPPHGPDEPMVIYMLGVPAIDPADGETSHEILRRVRHQVYSTPFETYEQEIRDQLQGLLGEYGFNHEADIQAITVNRWPHGYAYEYMSLDDPEWEPGQAPHEIGRARFGRISIANSDSEARAYLDAAIDAGWRAVAEQTT